jgi:hypothetical protein
MAEPAELRTIANTNGGAAIMSPSPQRSDFPEGVFVLNRDVFSGNKGAPGAEPAGISVSGRQVNSASGVNPADSRGAHWASLDANDRKVFNIWARRVAAFYSLLMFSLVVAMLLNARMPAGRTFLATSPVVERNSPQMPAPKTGDAGK